MEILLQANTSFHSSVIECPIKVVSAPTVPAKEVEPTVKLQTSAPSYLHSLKENDTPPFKKSVHEARPHLLIGTIMNEEETVEMIATTRDNKEHGLKKFLGTFLVEKKVIVNYNISEKTFLISFLHETIEYAAKRDFSAFKLACLITIYLDTHLYFKWYYWLPPVNVWYYFKELMIRHTIEDSPDGQEVFEPEECYDILSHFHTAYMSNLPLLHTLTFGAYRLKFLWPFKLK